jgi:SAM-dependent methyltransferase
MSDFLGPIPARRVAVIDRNYRESLMAAGFNPRQRAMLDLAQEALALLPQSRARIYAHEALTEFALVLRGRYPRFIGSEYAETEAEKADLAPIPAIDIAGSPFPDGLFDLVLSAEVLEHIPDVESALRDTARILKPGGRLLATFPFNYHHSEPIVKARREGGRTVYLTDPEYHGNPAKPEVGSLVYQIPGWSILDLARDVGFATADIIFWSSLSRGFTATELAGILVLSATR